MHDSFVSVLTPVYNGALYLGECIQSVLRQTHENIEFVLVDNGSTDNSYDIASAAAALDKRIRVVRGDQHVGPIQNWNRALGQVSANADYIKFVHADDWLFDTCIERMVGVAEQDSRIGLVSAYRVEENQVSLDKLPAAAPFDPGTQDFAMNGREVARAILLENASVLGSPSNVLLKTSAMGKLDEFFNTEYLHADKEAALKLLQEADFGFVRQVLTFTRRHNESVTSMTNVLDTRRQENLLFLRKYGRAYLSEVEFSRAWSQSLGDYYHFLASKFGTRQGTEFWRSHRANLDKAGTPFSRTRLYRASLRRCLNPARTFREYRRELASLDRSSVDTNARELRGFLDLSRHKRAAKD